MSSRGVCSVVCALIVMLTASGNIDAAEHPVVFPSQTLIELATLEWPPYSTQDLPGGGETVQKITQVFHHMGYRTKIDFLPWSRAAKSTAGAHPIYLGYFPKYPLTDSDSDSDFILSAAIGHSEVGLAEQIKKQLYLLDINALKRYRVGVVQDYVNTSAIDGLIASGAIKPVISINDRQNLVRLFKGDIDAAVIDKKVMEYLLQNDTELRKEATKMLQFNPMLSEIVPLHIAFSRYHPAAVLIEQFNRTLQQLNDAATAIESR
jgi:polar amino acid transport system substrate-binding protein